MSLQPSDTASGESLWFDIGDGETLGTNSGIVTGSWQTDLGTDGVQDLQAQVTSGENWYALGIKLNNETRAGSAQDVQIDDYTGGSQKPSITVFYTEGGTGSTTTGGSYVYTTQCLNTSASDGVVLLPASTTFLFYAKTGNPINVLNISSTIYNYTHPDGLNTDFNLLLYLSGSGSPISSTHPFVRVWKSISTINNGTEQTTIVGYPNYPIPEDRFFAIAISSKYDIYVNITDIELSQYYVSQYAPDIINSMLTNPSDKYNVNACWLKYSGGVYVTLPSINATIPEINIQAALTAFWSIIGLPAEGGNALIFLVVYLGLLALITMITKARAPSSIYLLVFIIWGTTSALIGLLPIYLVFGFLLIGVALFAGVLVGRHYGGS